MVALDGKFKDHQNNIIHPEGNMNVCTECPGNLSSSCRDISLKPNVNLVVALKEKSRKSHSHVDSSSGDYECLEKISSRKMFPMYIFQRYAAESGASQIRDSKLQRELLQIN